MSVKSDGSDIGCTEGEVEREKRKTLTYMIQTSAFHGIGKIWSAPNKLMKLESQVRDTEVRARNEVKASERSLKEFLETSHKTLSDDYAAVNTRVNQLTTCKDSRMGKLHDLKKQVDTLLNLPPLKTCDEVSPLHPSKSLLLPSNPASGLTSLSKNPPQSTSLSKSPPQPNEPLTPKSKPKTPVSPKQFAQPQPNTQSPISTSNKYAPLPLDDEGGETHAATYQCTWKSV
ncbi:hypothetical protein BaRGS_00013672 [Batillaria attramentaria]|uniref:Uncharacterized protein n=1 Tax=Batillaria attramentaria TaxID=370345 RepID=A0ABD0L6E8_9CAEN